MFNRQAPLVSLCPEGMLALSGSNNNNKPVASSKQQDLASNFSTAAASAGTKLPVIPQQIKEDTKNIEKSVSDLVEMSTKLEQDNFETNVEEAEWVTKTLSDTYKTI